jgi:hypothetical protein
MPDFPIIHLPKGYIEGLTHSNNGSDANNDIDIAAGYAVSDDADPADRVMIHLSSAITKRLDASWAVGSGNGGLATGSKANSTDYATWIWKRPNTGVVDVTYDPSFTSPTVPDAAYTKKQLIGFVRTDGSGNILAFTHHLDSWVWASPFAIWDGTSPATNDPLIAAAPPIKCKVNLTLYGNNSGAGPRLSVNHGDNADGSNGGRIGTQVGGVLAPGSMIMRTNASGQIRYDASTATGWSQALITVTEIDDMRGRR